MLLILFWKTDNNMEEFKCPLCKNEYNQNNPPRLLTMCGHTYCHHCIKTIIKRKDYRYLVRCPDDRLSVNVETNSPSHFPKNIALLEAIRRQSKAKEDALENNEFLPDHNINLKRSAMLSESRSSLAELKEGLLGYRRLSLEEGMCLLHRKPLDIVCIEEKIHICAECALFGLHKGHSFTTLKELFQKNKEWSHHITEIIEEKKHIDTKILNGEIEKEVTSILNKKKDLLHEEIDCCIKRIKQKIDLYEKSIKKELDEKIEKLQIQLRQIMTIDPKLEDGFMTWTSKVDEKCHQIYESFNDSRIVIVDSQDEDLLLEGSLMLQNMKNELIRYWSKIQSVLEYPKLVYSQQIQQNFSNLIRFQEQPMHVKNEELLSMDITKLEDHSLMDAKRDTPILQEVSLLDICNGFKFQESEANINLSQISFNEPLQYKSSQNLQKSELLPQRHMKRVKSRQLNLNMSVINSIDKHFSSKTPKQKMRTQILSKKTISSPTSPKAKLRRFVLKVKEPEKFEKIINSLQADSIDNIDLTGYDIGDEVAKQLCLKIQQCKKPKMLRLMKNSLTDESLKEVIGSLKVIDYLNLAQNAFTDKVFDVLLELTKSGLGKGKTIQLGQNKLNSRKFKDKIDELKKVGVIITL